MKLKKEGVACSWMFACVAILYFLEVVDAITDPRAFTTKPPIHREAVLPWYLNDEDLPPPEEYLASDSSINARNAGPKKSINYVIEAAFAHPPSNPSYEETTTDYSDSDDNVGTKNVHHGNKNNLYEGISTSSKKPTMVKIVVPMAPSQVNTVARYDKRSGVAQCPNSKSTGHFVYPPDCKFFVNCHQGRAYVEPCAPGTLFNPDSLECDFPNKVKCRDERKIDYPNSDYTSRPSLQLIKPKEIKCPPGHTGMLPHPETCTKFLQCLQGGTFIMDCGPGTAFNPKISVCDWPYNVPACSKNRSPQSSDQNNHGNNDRYGSSGGITDHGRPNRYENHQGNSGTRDGRNRWNGEKQPDRIIYPDEYAEYDQTGSADGRYDDGHAHNREQRPRQHESNGGTFNVPPRPLNWNKPGNSDGAAPGNGGQYDQSKWFDKGVRQYDNPDESQTIGQWNTQGYVNGNANRPRDRQFEYDQSNDKRWTSQQAQDPENDEYTGESSYNRRHYVNVHNGYNHGDPSSWSHEGERQHSEEDGRESTQTSSNDWSGYHDRNHDHRDGQLHHHHHHHNHHHPQGYDHRYDSGGRQEVEGPKPDRPGPNYPANDRTGYGRTNTGFPNPRQDGSFGPNENNDRQYGWKPVIAITTPRPTDDEYYPSQPVWNRRVIHTSDNREMRPSQPEQTGSESGVFVPSPWRGRQFDDNQGSPPTSNVSPQDQWNQGNTDNPGDKKLDDWSSKTNVIQRGDKRNDQDTKMDDWGSKTNIFDAQQGHKRPGVKTNSKGPQNTGPSGIYVNVNGTRGHYITKEIEVNQGHSNTRNYGQLTTEVPPHFNNNGNRFNEPPTSATSITENSTYTNKYEPIRSNKTYTRWKPMRYKPMNSTSEDSKPSVYPKANNGQYYPNEPSYQQQTPITFTTARPSLNFESSTQSTENQDHITNSYIELPTVSIEEDHRDRSIFAKKIGKQRETIDFGDVVEADVDNYEIEVLDKESWKLHSKLENKTKKTNVESAIMKINKNNVNSEILDVELAPWPEDTPQFPVYYVAPVHPLGHTPKPTRKTPSSGQILRLRGGSSPRDGYLEVQGVHPGWGVVCDSKNGWSLKEAHVVCRQLGYTRGAEMAWQGRIQSDKTEIPWIATTQVDCKGNESQFQMCKFVHGQECLVKRDAVGVRCMANRLVHCRDDELAHEGQCYHLANPDSGLNHAEALEYCASRKAQLVDVTSQAENNFLSEWLMHYYPKVNSVMTSGIGFTTFNKTLWLWEDSARAKFQFNKWWPGWRNEKKLPPWPGSRPVCVIMKKQFPCHEKPEAYCSTDYFFWDVEDCATSMKGHSYVCERPYDDIGCVYGKGQLYEGNANVSASGKKCLPWKDPTLNHPLRVNVLNPEVKEKLMTHNYCRNPNPLKESRPWCFIGLYGEREYCDIPPCGEIGMKRSPTGGKCKPKHFECMPGECIPSPWVCDGEEDCTNGIDEMACSSHLGFFKKTKDHRLDGHDVEKWLNTPAKTCALRCKEADFTCRSFSHKSNENLCLLSDTNIGLSGDLVSDVEYDYYEMIDRTINCNGMFVCGNEKCINRTQVCDGKNDCGDRSDETICTVEKLDYEIRLAGSNNTYEGRVEVKVLGHWGQVCDDGFGMNDANVVCRELGFELGALEINPGGFFGNMDPPERFMVDQLKCRGNETSIRECDFDGWGVHNCRPEEAVGVVCKSAVNTCQLGHWKCDTSPTCIPTTFICDDVADCPDESDENAAHCMAPFELRLANGSNPLEGRVEVRHHGVWGTVCDDDFTHSAAKVICRALGYGGQAVAKKNGYFGPGDGPIWLDEVFCHGNETQLSKCEHNPWGRHNCDHDEDAGVICTEGSIDDSQFDVDEKGSAEFNISELLPSDCGRRPEDFSNGDDEIFQRVVRGSIAPKGSYPWQASLRIRGHSRSSHWCGAVILSPLHVLTAAHCLEGYNKGAYFIRAGDYHSEIDEGTEVEANIEDYFIHEDFRKGQRMNNDIALVLLKGHGIPLGEHIMPICLPPKNAEYSPGLNCTISGFGSIENGQSAQSLNLRYGWVPLLDQSVCRADYVYGREKISEGMICAGFLDEGVDACDGDSGGPLACQNNGAFTLYGVTSWGHHCGEPNKPGVYVRVAHYRDWIDQKIHESLFGR